MKVFVNLVNISASLELDQLKKIVKERLQEGKDESICEAVEKYAGHFLVEFTHFLRMHGFHKQPKAQSIAISQVQSSAQEQKLIQQNNFFQIQQAPQVAHQSQWIERVNRAGPKPERKRAAAVVDDGNFGFGQPETSGMLAESDFGRGAPVEQSNV